MINRSSFYTSTFITSRLQSGRHMINTCTIGLIILVLSSHAFLTSFFIIDADNLLFACSMYFLAYMSFLINFLYFIGEVILFGTADWTFGIVSPSVISGKLDLGSCLGFVTISLVCEEVHIEIKKVGFRSVCNGMPFTSVYLN